MRRRQLSADETELWRRVVRTATPLDARRAPPPPPTETEPKAPATAPIPAVGRDPRPAGGAAVTAGDLHPHPTTLDRRTNQRLRRGRLAIDARFDLHGHTQASAHSALLRFLERARANGSRHVLVVTGRGAEGGGILKRSVPRWLGEPAFQRHVAGFHEAGPRHGGAGALYIVLRRRRG